MTPTPKLALYSFPVTITCRLHRLCCLHSLHLTWLVLCFQHFKSSDPAGTDCRNPFRRFELGGRAEAGLRAQFVKRVLADSIRFASSETAAGFRVTRDWHHRQRHDEFAQDGSAHCQAQTLPLSTCSPRSESARDTVAPLSRTQLFEATATSQPSSIGPAVYTQRRQ